MHSILLTGANGYVAKQIYEKLHQKYNITRLTRQDFDLTDTQAVKGYFTDRYFDIIIHTATQGGSRLKKDDGNVCYHNLLMIENLLNVKHFFNNNCEYQDGYGRLINLSSGAELHRTKSKQPYGLSKKIITNICSKLDWVHTLRIWNVFNENQLDTRFIKTGITNYIKHDPIKIPQDKWFDFFHIDDFLDLLENIIRDRKYFRVVNCVYSNFYRLSKVAEMINNLSDYKVPVIIEKQFNMGDSDSHYFCKPCFMRCPFDNLEQKLKQTYYKIRR